jgi:hypothetical protein
MIDVQVTTQFNRPRVMRALSLGRAKALNHIGGYVRLVAQRSIKKGKRGPSLPGRPPHSQIGTLRTHIYYSYDERSASVIIGPSKVIMQRDSYGQPMAGMTVPQVLEKGGAIGIPEPIKRAPRVKRPRGPRELARIREWYQDNPRPVKHRYAAVAARPYMVPAMHIGMQAKALQEAWRNVIR